jgi:2-iminoacetate synthase
MEFAIPGFIKRFCTRNGLLTLAEYLEDYSSEQTKADGYKLIDRELAKMPEGNEKKSLMERLAKIKNEGQRDLLY